MSDQHRHPNKLMVTILGSPYSEYLINYTHNLAKKLNTSWLAIYVKTPKVLSPEEQELLKKNLEIAEKLHAEIVIVESENIFESIALCAKQHQVKQLILGRALKKLRFLNWYNDPHRKILEIYPEVDIITINTGSKLESVTYPNHHTIFNWEFDKNKLPATIFSLLFFTSINLLLVDVIDYRSLGMIFLLGITISAALFKNYSTLIGVTLSTLLWNYIFIPPRFTFHTYSKEDWAMLITFFVIAYVVGSYTRKLKANESILLMENINRNNLYSLLKTLSAGRSLEETLKLAQNIIFDKYRIKSKIEIKHRSFIFSSHQTEEEHIEYISFLLEEHHKQLGTIEFEKQKYELLSIEDKLYLDSIIQQIIISIEKDVAQLEIEKINLKKESEKIFQALLSSVSHELRTPLSTIKGFASALNNPIIGQTPTMQVEISNEIIEGVERLDGLVQNLLDMSRIDAGQLKLKKTEIDPSDLINSAILKNKKRFPERNILFSPNTHYAYIWGDYVLLQQTIENLIRNSCLYAEGKIWIKTFLHDNWIKIQIEDEGPGIKNLDHIFDKFYRENPQLPGGIGIGLNLCKSIVELHQGNIVVENKTPTGARFTICLPKVEYDTSI